MTDGRAASQAATAAPRRLGAQVRGRGADIQSSATCACRERLGYAGPGGDGAAFARAWLPARTKLAARVRRAPRVPPRLRARGLHSLRALRARDAR